MSKNITIENAHITFRNFSGKPSKFNHDGARSFGIRLDEVQANEMRSIGFNVKPLAPMDESDEPAYNLTVAVNYGMKPPAVYMIAGGKKTLLDEETISTLDYADIEMVDLTINAYEWEFAGNSGVKAYLKSLYVTVSEDDLADKYANL